MINAYHNAIRDRIESLKNQGDVRRLIVWEIQDDESKDHTLLSYRVYGTRDHADVVRVAAGASGIWEALPLKRIALLTLSDVLALRREWLV